MKKIILSILILCALAASSQQKDHAGLYRFDSLYSSLAQKGIDTTAFKIVVQRVSDGKLFRMYWPTSGGSSTFFGLSDVNATSTANNDMYAYDNATSKIVNKTPAQIRTILGLATIATSGSYNDLLNRPNIIQTLNVQYTDVSNSGSTETNLMSYTIPASQLTNVGDRIVIEGMFTTPSGNSNSKNLKWYFGSTTQIWDASTIATGTSVHVRITIIRTGTGTQKLVQEFHTGFTSIESYTTSGQDETATISMRFASIGTATNDITQRTMTVTYYPYTP